MVRLRGHPTALSLSPDSIPLKLPFNPFTYLTCPLLRESVLPLTEGSRNRQSRVGPRRQRGLGPKLELEKRGRQPQVPRLDEALSVV